MVYHRVRLHGLALETTLLVDNDAHKAVAGEEANMLLVPHWMQDAVSDGDLPMLVDLLVEHLPGAVDARALAQRVRAALIQRRVATHGAAALTHLTWPLLEEAQAALQAAAARGDGGVSAAAAVSQFAGAFG